MNDTEIFFFYTDKIKVVVATSATLLASEKGEKIKADSSI